MKIMEFVFENPNFVDDCIGYYDFTESQAKSLGLKKKIMAGSWKIDSRKIYAEISK